MGALNVGKYSDFSGLGWVSEVKMHSSKEK
ncbi:uncharacterized protein G2W53_020468 [Senna tora]|uniref:Uncharacterized protein n=1 Tax=Senna tora TaxID=362788 RepID=A0A834U382_9FABA|nr:uncharacterized protein G2W53_020468 [Senna tora]